MRLSRSFALLSALVPLVRGVPASGSGPSGRQSTTNSYDFIIVGGGTAGAALAARLTEEASFQVLMIEAGPAPDSINTEEEVPGLNFFLEGSNLDWNFTTSTDSGLNGRSFLYTRGKCIGGSSVINFLAFNRGSESVYNNWVTLGNEGWGWTDVLPYFTRYAHFTTPTNTADSPLFSQITFNSAFYNSSAEPLQISFGEYIQPYDQYWYPAVQDIGIPTSQDFNGGNAVGVAHMTTSINPSDESRSSAYTTYYAAAEGRSNFHVYSETMVTKILLRNVSDTTEAYGVEFTFANGTTGQALANKEVIVSAGAVQGPQLFMLSGLGPQATLNQFGIQAYQYLEGVGTRFQDHPSFYINVEVPDTLPTAGFDFPTELEADLSQWETDHTGPMASMNGDTPAFKRYNNTFLDSIGASDLAAFDDYPNIEYLVLPAYDNPGFPNPPNATGNYVTILAALVSPSSLGSVTISSTDINDQPVINVNYYDTTADQEIAVAALQDALAITETAAWAPIYLGRDRVFPTADLVASYDDMLNYIRNSATTVWHASGTMPMLPQASGGVVDNELRVYGVSNLRIVDASIQPRITNQHVQAVVYMIAEKAADLLKAQYA